MRRTLSRAGRVAGAVFAASSLASSLAPPARAAQPWEVRVHLRHADGREESLRVGRFRFVYYDRRFIHHASGFGRAPTLRVEDTPRERHWIQNDELKKIRFAKMRSLGFAYRDLDGERTLHLVVTRRKGKGVIWPAFALRNAATSRTPHFRGEVEGKTLDFPIPPPVESAAPEDRVLTGVDFEFAGQKPNRKRF